jgi:hypothetical protein
LELIRIERYPVLWPYRERLPALRQRLIVAVERLQGETEVVVRPGVPWAIVRARAGARVA